MTTSIDAAGRPCRVERRSAARVPGRRAAGAVRPGRERWPVGRVVPRAPQPAAGDAGRRSGDWLWLTSVAISTFLIVMLVGLFGVRDAPTTGGTALVEVRAGDTLREIAERVVPGADPRAVVDRIVEVNGPGAAAAEPGRLLLVPVDD